MKITIFTLALNTSDPNKTMDYPLHKLCLNSWEKIKKFLTNKGYECDLIIYNEESNEFKYIVKDCLSNTLPVRETRRANVFRIYMLSKHERFLWLDWDIFIRDNFTFDFESVFLMKNWSMIYNHTNLELFAAIYNEYKNNPELMHLKDKSVSEYLLNNNIINFKFCSPNIIRPYMVHCGCIDNQPSETLYFISDEEESSNFVLEHLEDRQNYRFINIKKAKHEEINGLMAEPELIKFLLDNYELSAKQIEILKSYL